MSGRNILVALCGAALIAGCGVKHVAPGSPVMGQKVQVREFDMSGAQVSSYEGATGAYGLETAQKIATALRQAGVDAEAIPRSGAATGQVIVEGQVVDIDGGSRALRYWIGFGAGATRFGVHGKARRANGTALGEFADERRSGFGMFGGDSEELMHRCTEAVAEDVAAMIVSGEFKKQ